VRLMNSSGASLFSAVDEARIEQLRTRFESGEIEALFMAVRVIALAGGKPGTTPYLGAYPRWMESAMKKALIQVAFNPGDTFEQALGRRSSSKRKISDVLDLEHWQDVTYAFAEAIEEGKKAAGLKYAQGEDKFSILSIGWSELMKQRPYARKIDELDKRESADVETIKKWHAQAKKRGSIPSEFLSLAKAGIVARIVETKSFPPWTEMVEIKE